MFAAFHSPRTLQLWFLHVFAGWDSAMLRHAGMDDVVK